MHVEKCSGEKSLSIQCASLCVHSTMNTRLCACGFAIFWGGYWRRAHICIYKRISKQIHCEPRHSCVYGWRCVTGWLGQWPLLRLSQAHEYALIHTFLLLYAYTLRYLYCVMYYSKHHHTMVVHTAAKSYSTPRLIDK